MTVVRRRVIFTGPPGSGKTAVLTALSRTGVGVVAEAATDVIAEMQEHGQPEPWTDLSFTERIVALQRQRQLAADGEAIGVTAYDRSPMCTLALARYLAHPVGPLLHEELDRVKRENTYERTVLFVEPIGRIVATAARRISYEDSLIFGDLHRKVYAEQGYTLVDLPPVSMEARVRLVMTMLAEGEK